MDVKLASNNGYCPLCGKFYNPNGIGPSDSPVITEFLHNLPSSHLFFEAANRHDLDYHIGKTEYDRGIADFRFLENMLYEAKKCNWFLSKWYATQAYRNYLAVRLFGENFFNYSGCV